jgi:hypothetical protein
MHWLTFGENLMKIGLIFSAQQTTLKIVSDQPTKTLKTIYEAYQLSQLISEGTRITNRSCTLIDHYVPSMPEKINLSGVILYIPELVITV